MALSVVLTYRGRVVGEGGARESHHAASAGAPDSATLITRARQR